MKIAFPAAYLKWFSIAIFISLLNSCQNSPKKASREKNQAPIALQDNKNSYEIGLSKKRQADNLVDALFKEKIKNSPDLKAIDDLVAKLNDGMVNDSLGQLHDFNNKNAGYYNDALLYTRQIADPALKEKMELLINTSQKHLGQTTAQLNSLDSILNKRSTTLQEHYSVLKIITTIAIMEEYQKNNKPSVQPIQAAITQFDKATQKADSASGIK